MHKYPLILRAALVVGSFGLLTPLLHCDESEGVSEFPDGGDACTTTFKGKCGLPCTADPVCPDGLYCTGGKCAADCAPGSTCQGGIACSPRGRCGPDNPSFLEGGRPDATDGLCADTNVVLTKVNPKVLLLLDQSSSMYLNKFPTGPSNNCNPDCRWTVLKDVLIGEAATPGGLVKQLQADAEFGLALYSATDADPNDFDNSFLTGPTDNVCPRFNGKAFTGVSFALNAFAAIDAALRPAGVDDDTPTGPAIRTVAGLADDGSVVAASKGFATIAGNAPKVIVLVTDGEPGICGANNPSDAGRAAVVLAAQHAFAQKIRTFVIAIGDTSAAGEAHFKAVANAGQGKDPINGDANAILPSTPTQLVEALRQIVVDARTCTFTLKGKVQAGSERLGTVTLNGAAVPFDEPGAPDEGWRLKSESELELVGAACATLKSSPNATFSARFPCGTFRPN